MSSGSSPMPRGVSRAEPYPCHELPMIATALTASHSKSSTCPSMMASVSCFATTTASRSTRLGTTDSRLFASSGCTGRAPAPRCSLSRGNRRTLPNCVSKSRVPTPGFASTPTSPYWPDRMIPVASSCGARYAARRRSMRI